MRKLKFFSILILLISGLTLTNCGKKGCTDGDAKNFCDKCKRDDGTCTFEGSIVFWYNQSTSSFLIGDGATSLTYYVNGAVVGSSATSVYYGSAPNCGQNASITVTKDLGKDKSKSYTYSVKDQTGFEYYTGTVTFKANTCTSYELN